MFRVVKTSDNRREVKERRLRSRCIDRRTWTRRIQWLESDDLIKLKFEEYSTEGEAYREVLVPQAWASTVWARFQEGLSIDDSISIFTRQVPAELQSRKEVNRGRTE